MAIEKVEIKNFTVFEDISIEMSKGINVFIGENGTGKTHLLKILYAMTDVTKYRTPFLGINEFEGNRAIISNNFDHLIYFLFNAPVDGLAVNLVRNKFTHQLESAKIVVSTDSETFTSYVAGLEFVAATSPSDMGDRAFGNESFFIPAKDMLSHSGIEGDFEKRLLPF
ncbi:MAG: ATP-binding protein, partial [Defluviitaleaceae bacterium]|nr:ATP-binding protein [Defluviitaleaceae bacterium]